MVYYRRDEILPLFNYWVRPQRLIVWESEARVGKGNIISGDDNKRVINERSEVSLPKVKDKKGLDVSREEKTYWVVMGNLGTEVLIVFKLKMGGYRWKYF